MSQFYIASTSSGPPGSGIKTINGIFPDGAGNFSLTGSDVGQGGILISPIANGDNVSSRSGGFVWQQVPGVAVALLAGNGYILTNVGTTNASLPPNAITHLGDTIKIVAASGPANVTQSASQQIALGADVSTVGAGGSLNFTFSNDYGFVTLTFIGIIVGGTYLWVVGDAPEGNFGVT